MMETRIAAPNAVLSNTEMNRDNAGIVFIPHAGETRNRVEDAPQ